MKNKALYYLSKQQLYFIYQSLKSSDLSDNILNSIQFFDVKPSEMMWDTYISATENKVIHFDESLTCVKMYHYFSMQEQAFSLLNQILAQNKTYLLFYDRQNCILFSEVFLKQVIEATNFFNTESYVLYGLETQQVITGGWQGFTHWLKT